MAKRNLSKSQPAAPEKPQENPQRSAKTSKPVTVHSELTAIAGELAGLQSFIKAIGEAGDCHDVVNLQDLTFGFSYLLDLVEAHIERALELVADPKPVIQEVQRPEEPSGGVR